MGTFLVRSGVLTSVHAFAVDPARGVFILAIMGVFIGGALTLFAWRAPLLPQGGLFAPISREGSLVLNNLLLTTACAAVFVGTLYPLALEALTGDKISVGPALLQSHLRAADRSAADRRAVRAAAGVEAGRPARRGAAADGGCLRGARRRHLAAGLQPTRPVARAVRHRARRVAHHGRADRNLLPGEARSRLRRQRYGGACAICRAPPMGRRWRIPGSGLR